MLDRLSTTLLALSLASPLGTAQDTGASPPRPQLSLSLDRGQYKRIHQVALRLILRDRAEEARTFLLDHREREPKDAETAFMLGLERAQAGELEASEARMREALEFGLPPGRLLAGPRGLLAPLDDSELWKDVRSRVAGRPLHGPIVGDVGNGGASFWMRLAAEQEAVVVVSEREDLSDPLRSGVARASAASDHTVVCRVDGLAPSRLHHYALEVDGERVEGSSATFRTPPAAGASAAFTLAFGGGAGYVPPHERMWDTIRAHEPLALLLLGDNVYIDDPESREMQQYTYYRRQSRPEFRALTARTAVYTIWDDHDFGTNDCWGGAEIEAPGWKRDPVWTVYRQNWPNPGFGGGEEQPGCWYSFRIGDVEFLMLDCRYYRTSPRIEAPSMLGPAQLAWLDARLAAARSTFTVLCSSVPWDYRTKGASRDTWNGFQAERDRVFDMIDRHGVEGVVLLSADRHRSDAWKIDRGERYALYEFNSSRLTNQHVHPTMEKAGAIFSYNAKQSFGLVRFDTTLEDPTVTYEVRTIDDEAVHSLTVRRSELE